LNFKILGLAVLAVGLVAFAFSFTAPANTVGLPVAQGKVYDIYACSITSGECTQVAVCTTFDEVRFFQVNNAQNVYSLSLDSNCGPFVMVTATTMTGTTFASGTQSCPPGYSRQSDRTCVATSSAPPSSVETSTSIPPSAANSVRLAGAALTIAGVVLLGVWKARGDALSV
jgi:hypothetical protein